jgi:hypothetical protein
VLFRLRFVGARLGGQFAGAGGILVQFVSLGSSVSNFVVGVCLIKRLFPLCELTKHGEMVGVSLCCFISTYHSWPFGHGCPHDRAP